MSTQGFEEGTQEGLKEESDGNEWLKSSQGTKGPGRGYAGGTVERCPVGTLRTSEHVA